MLLFNYLDTLPKLCHYIVVHCFVAESPVQPQQTVLAWCKLYAAGRGSDDRLFPVTIPHHATQQRSAESLSQPALPTDVPLCAGERAA